MRHFQDPAGNVFGYTQDQTKLVAAALKNGWAEITGAWPPREPIEHHVEDKRGRINAAYETAAAKFKSRYPRTEIDGWPEQVRALDMYDADPNADNVLLDVMAVTSGVTRAVMAESIRAARSRYVYAYALLTGLRQRLEGELNALPLDAPDAKAQIAAIDETEFERVNLGG